MAVGKTTGNGHGRGWPRSPLTIGAAAAVVSGAAMVLARLYASARTPVDMLFDLTGHLLGVPAVFNVIHALPGDLGQYAKYVLFVVMALVYLALWTVAAPSLARLTRPWRVVLPALLTPALVGLVLLPLEGLAPFGLSTSNYFYPPLATHLWAMLFGALYGLVLLAAGAPAPAAGHDAGRRDALDKAARGLVLMVAGAGVLRLAAGALARAAALQGLLAKIKGLPTVVTSVKDHYVVSKNFVDPKVDEGRWRLKIHGLVEHTLDLKLADLKALPSLSRTSTLICISNEVGGHLVGNSTWTGVLLKDLLDMVGVKPGASHMIMRAADNYSDAVPLDVAQRDGNLVAYLQDGEPLVRAHGFPARMLIPGLYGMKSVKWLVDIELVDRPYTGYWEERGWSQTAVVHTMSRIDTPLATTVDGGAAIGGIAFAGLRGVKAVQVSLDGGQTWRPATLRPADNPYSWTLWGLEWNAPRTGEVDALVRAVDGDGKVQTSARRQPLPDGATGYDEVRVKLG
ncbi:MAG TPA: molybdopterin-dependent oxidoreductase [Trueperaceae bacterium]|nr:molybdopterin-dependent oxidoreductase [Trueperaceae bacterium]